MKNFNTIDQQLFYSFYIDEEEKSKIDILLELLNGSEVSKIINDQIIYSNFGRPSYDPYKLFTVILLAFTLGKSSLREIESACHYDVRFFLILGEKVPDHTTFSRFINKIILPRRDEIFTCITKTIFSLCNIKMDTVFIDGTKQEAKSNKYKFVWKPITFHNKLCDKVRSLLRQMELEEGIPEKGIIPSSVILNKYNQSQKSKIPTNLTEKAFNCMQKNLLEYYEKATEYEKKENICGPNRNSYYKTDHDATAMCLKQDYYSGLGSNMHAAYSVQLLVSYGFITTCYISQERIDMFSFIPTLDLFYSMYNIYPSRIGADSGYGCTANYKYCKDHNIRAFVKFQDWEGEHSGKRPAVYEIEEDGSIICIGGRKGFPVTIEGRHPRRKGTKFYRIENCTGCIFMPYCRRFMKELVGTEKIFEVDPTFHYFKKEARDLLLSVEGIEMRVNRSCQVEGAFGAIKNNMSYLRIRRISLPKVQTEILLTYLGYNLRKYIKYAQTGKGISYWKAPTNLEPGEYRKPSAKRLANRAYKQQLKTLKKNIGK